MLLCFQVSFLVKFKDAIIRPHLKKSNLDVDQLKHYRPVSNTHFLSTIMEKLVIGRLEDHMLKNLLYDPFQSAYRKQHSTETAILKVQNDIIASLDVDKCTVLGSLDLSAAFDTVDHHILLKRMRHLYGIDDTAWCWFESYLDNRHTKVRINDSLSSSRVLVCGVPQGSVLGARLYSMLSTQFRISSNNMASTITATLMTFKYICSVKIQMLTYKNPLPDYKTAFSKLAIG